MQAIARLFLRPTHLCSVLVGLVAGRPRTDQTSLAWSCAAVSIPRRMTAMDGAKNRRETRRVLFLPVSALSLVVMEADPEGWVSSPLSATSGLPPSCAGCGRWNRDSGQFQSLPGHRTQDTAQDSTGHRPVGLGSTSTSTAPQPAPTRPGAWGRRHALPWLPLPPLTPSPPRHADLSGHQALPARTQPFGQRPPIGHGGSLASRHSPSDPLPSHRGRGCGMTH